MLRDVIGDAGLVFYHQVSLVIFLSVFAGICIYVFVKKKCSWEDARRMPLEDDGDIREGRPNG